MSPSQAIQIALLLPVVGAVLVMLAGRWPNLRETISLVIATCTFGVVLTLLPEVLDGKTPSFNLVQIFPEIWIGFRLEPLGMLFALVASGLWILTTAYAIGYMRGHHETNQTRFFTCFALAIFGALGVAFARNLVMLFLFYELLTISTYPLVTHAQNDAARRSGRIYLGILMSTSVLLLLLAVVWTWDVAGTTEFRPGGILEGRADPTTATVLLLLFAFGTGKAALMPFHRWLPAAMVAPTPVSALLHAVAVVKAGVFTVMKVSVYIFGTDFLATVDSSQWLCWVAAFTILCASMVAFTKNNLALLLAGAGRASDAEAPLRRAAQLRPHAAPAHRHLGDTLRALGRPAEADAASRRALAAEPADGEATLALGRLLLERGERDAALGVLRHGVRWARHPEAVQALIDAETGGAAAAP